MNRELLSHTVKSVRNKHKLIPWLLFMSFSAVIIVIGFVHLDHEFKLHRQNAFNELESIANLKASQIQKWRTERYTDASQLFRTPVLQELAIQYLANPQSEPQREKVLQIMDMYRTTIDYRAIVLLDANGQKMLSLPASINNVCNQSETHLANVYETQSIVVGDLHYTGNFAGDKEHISYSYWIPILRGPKAQQAVIGVWVLQLDPDKYLYPLTQSWPVASKTAETLLVRREGDEVVMLNDLRHRPDAALKLRFKISEHPDLPAVMAATGRHGAYELRDFRGQRVFAVLTNIGNSPWVLVTKVDSQEVMQLIWIRAVLTTLLMLILIVTLALALSHFSRKKDYRWLQSQLLLEQEKSLFQEEFQNIAQQWQTTFDSIRDLVFILDSESRIVRTNKAAVFPSLIDAQDLIGRHCFEVVHGFEGHHPDCPYQRMKMSFVREEMELKLGDCTYQVTVDPILGENGELSGAVHVVRDITQSKIAEAEIAKMNRLYALISQINQMVVRTKDQEAILRDACEIAIEYGKFKMAWIGKVDYQHKLLKPINWAGEVADYFKHTEPVIIDDVPAGGGPSGAAIRSKKAVICNDIEHDPIMNIWKTEALKRDYRSVIVLPIIVKEQVAYTFCLYSSETGFFNDSELRLLDEVTGDIAFALEMVEAEKQARINEARTRQVINIAPFGAHGYELLPDGDLILIDANSSASEVLGMDMQPLIGKTILEAFPAIDPKLPEIYRTVAKGGMSYQDDHIAYKADGIESIYDIRAINTGENRMVVFFRDVTEMRKADAAIRKLNEELEHRVQERTAQLELLNKELEAFSYSVSHDLRSPLRGIDGWSQALFEDYEDTLDEQAKTYLGRIRSEAQRMNQLIEALLRLAHVSKKSITEEKLNLSAIASGVIDRLREQDPQRDVEVVVQPDIYTTADKYLFEIVLTNLLSNAWKFTAKRHNARIEFGIQIKGDTPEYYVKDNGAGFNMAHAQKLFGAFQRMHKPKDYPGTGIGLTTAQRIIMRHGGTIWAESEVDIGTTFYWTIRSNNNVL